MGLNRMIMDEVKDEISEQMKNNRTSYRADAQLSMTAKHLRCDKDGGIELTLVYVDLNMHQTMRLRLSKIDSYLEQLQSHMHLAHTLQTRQDVLRQISHKVMQLLDLKRAPVHFFDKDGQPLHNIDKLLAYLAMLPRDQDSDGKAEVIYCQDKMLFRSEYIANQGI